MNRDEARRLVLESRRAQGLPAILTDRATLDRIATALGCAVVRTARRKRKPAA